MPQENQTLAEPQRCLAKSPIQSTRTVKAGGDFVQVVGIPTAMTILEAKAALDKEWTRLHKLPAWDESKAKLKGKTVHFATLMDLCHLKNSELEDKVQKWCVVRDDSGTTPYLRSKVLQRHI